MKLQQTPLNHHTTPDLQVDLTHSLTLFAQVNKQSAHPVTAKGTGSQGHRATGSQGHRVTGSQGHRATGSQGHLLEHGIYVIYGGMNWFKQPSERMSHVAL